MPILTLAIAGLFQLLFAAFAKMATIGVAAAAAFLATSAAALIAVKLAFVAMYATIGLVVPTGIIDGFFMFLPSNMDECLTVILLADTVITHYDYFRNVLPVTFMIAKS